MIRIGINREVLLTIRTDADHPESIFVTLFLAAFLDSFGDDLTQILFGAGLTDGAAVDVVVHSGRAGSGVVANFVKDVIDASPVVIARIDPDAGEEVPLVVFAASNAMERLRAERVRGGDLEIILARFIAELLHAVSGASPDDEIYRNKLRDLLMSVLR